MLVLSRQKDESIMIGDDVEVTIVDVRGDKVRLGITAPKEIPVHRMEVYEAIQREKREKQAQEQEKSEKNEKQAQEREKSEKNEKQAQEQEKSEKRAEAK
jgi:carbon storage regulator